MELVRIRALEHFSYCPRKAALTHTDGVWFDNVHVLRGVRGHERVDNAPSRHERGRQVIRGLELWSDLYGLIGRADAVEVDPSGVVAPVEYKAGKRHGRNAEVQMCAQALCLEEMLDVVIDVGYVWYAGIRRRTEVRLDRELRDLTVATIEAIRADMRSRQLPPAVDDSRCDECQLRAHCLPGLVAHPDALAGYLRNEVWR